MEREASNPKLYDRSVYIPEEFLPKSPEETELGNLRMRVIFPQQILTNAHIEGLGLMTKQGRPFDSAQIMQSAGVERRFVAPDISVQRFAEAAASGVLSKNSEQEIERVVAITSFPSREDRIVGLGHAGSLAVHFGLSNVKVIGQENLGVADIHLACSGGAEFVEEIGERGKVLVVASEIYSPHLAENDTARAIFTDEAGAMIFTPNEDLTVLDSAHHTYPEELRSAIQMPVDYSAMEGPGRYINIPVPQNEDGSVGKFKMDGYTVYKQMGGVASQIKDMVQRAEKMGVEKNKIKKIIPHQASLKVLKNIRDSLGEENMDLQEKFHIDVRDGNSSSVSIMRAMGRQIRDHELKKDDIVMLVGFGAGLYSSLQLIKLGRR